MTEEYYIYMTEEGLQKIKEELEYLRTTKREDIAEKLEIAIAQGDLKENADYHAAKEEQAFVEGRIRDLADSVHRAKIIKDVGPSNVVRVGNTVTVYEIGYEDGGNLLHRWRSGSGSLQRLDFQRISHWQVSHWRQKGFNRGCIDARRSDTIEDQRHYLKSVNSFQ